MLNADVPMDLVRPLAERYVVGDGWFDDVGGGYRLLGDLRTYGCWPRGRLFTCGVVGVRRGLSCRDAVVLLGGDSRALVALDHVLAGALRLATSGVSDAVLSIFDAQGRIIRLGRDLVAGLGSKVRGAGGADRTRRLEAAHTVVVVTAYFEALAAAQLPFTVRDLRINRQDQIRLAGASASAEQFIDALLSVAPPRPAPDLPYERFADVLEEWYQGLSARLTALLRVHSMWSGLDDASRGAAEHVLGHVVCKAAVGRYQERYAQLAVEVPEFLFWAGQVEHQATRAEVRQALAGIESLLVSLSPRGRAGDVSAALSKAYRAVLRRPILAEGETPSGVRLPTLEDGYLDPDFRVAPVVGGELPSDEDWWDDVPVRGDLSDYLAGVLTSPEARAAPLVVLGQPGSGKSVLTKMLAARLPSADFVPVRVVLREVPAEAEVQDQIEYAIRAATGSRVEWPGVAQAAGGALPVVLLDGFDELLQATGVSQSDYLLKVAQFQQREADLGRPVVALVTSRTAVADRARYPVGTVALRLEPFRDEQVSRWLDIWNLHNERLLETRGLEPLPAAVVAQHRALASEPLLLMMLALYDADANALQRRPVADRQALDETSLYEQLLTSFAVREVAKTSPAVLANELAGRVEQELQRLSLIAFAMINRRRQWVMETELENDLAALLGRPSIPVASFKAPLTQANLAVGRFFFVQRAQAVREGSRLQTYEFLHATFGEYLAARLTVQLTAGLLAQRPVLTVAQPSTDDDLLYPLLSFAPLSSRQMLRFVQGICRRDVAAADQMRLAELLVNVLADGEQRTEDRHAGYLPTPLPTSSRHGIYSANLVLLILALAPSMTASELFPWSQNPPGTWHRRALLWRSALSEQDWTDLALALSVENFWNGSAGDLKISLSGDPRRPPEPIDPYWHYLYPPGHPNRANIVWHRPYWDQINHKMAISGGTNDSAIRHALEPVFHWLGPSITTFHGGHDGPASSIAHDLINLWLSRTLDPSSGGLAAAYQRLNLLFGPSLMWDIQLQRRATIVLLDLLRADVDRLPVINIIGHLREVMNSGPHDPQIISLILEIALATIPVADDAERRGQLTRLATQAVAAMRNTDAELLERAQAIITKYPEPDKECPRRALGITEQT